MVSIVVPVYNEEESLTAFYEDLLKNIPSFVKGQEYEIVFVDDGSTDNSLELLKKLRADGMKGHEKEKDKIRIYSFRKNMGKAEALTFGFAKAEGDMIVTLDADLQDKPSEVHKLFSKADEGVEVVCGWRKDRKDKSKMKIISKIFNGLLQRIFGLNIHDYNCGMKVYTKEAAKSLRLYGGLHRFIPLILYQQGFVVDEVAVQHEVRKYGKSKYGFSKLWKDLPDIFSIIFITKYSKRPMHFFGVSGGIFSAAGLLILGYLTLLRLSGERIGTRPLLFFGILLVLAGLQIFFTGFLADLIINLHQNSRKTDNQLHFPVKYSTEN